MKLHTFFCRMGAVLLIGILLAATVPVWARQDAPPPDTPQLGDGTLLLVQNTVLPIRDRLDLAKRVLGLTDIPEPPTTPPPEYNIGDIVTFTAGNMDLDYEFQVDAELVYKTPHIYMFVQEDQVAFVDLEALKESTDRFENLIIPKIHEVFGSEWTPGIDGDPHLYILNAVGLGFTVAGYFGSESEFPREAVTNSNEHEMFYINLDGMLWAIGTPYYEGTLTHEFQHMVHWNVDRNEDIWLNEGLSELAALIAGYGPSDFAPYFLSSPEVQLNAWPEDDDSGIHYGSSFMFVAYLYERYGEQAISTLVHDPANGLISVEDTLQAIGATDPTTGQPVTLVDLFGDWLVANLLNDTSFGDGRYGYTDPELAALGQADTTTDLALTDMPVRHVARQWGPNYLVIPGGPDPQRLRFTFDGDASIVLVPTQPHGGTYMWWSNRGDDSDTRLTHAFDLTGVSSATLHYWTWYYIEDLWDYGYVMVSTDNGVTWTPLATQRTTTEDPHSNAYGPGYTGQSREWVEEVVDLTPYAGQPVLVRFEYITDDAVTQPGMVIDDISIPEIGYSDNAEADDGGWTSEGWLRMDNVLPQNYLIELVQPDSQAKTPLVTRLLGPDDDPQGEWEITVGGSFGDAIIIVSGLAPVTTELTEYRYTLVEE